MLLDHRRGDRLADLAGPDRGDRPRAVDAALVLEPSARGALKTERKGVAAVHDHRDRAAAHAGPRSGAGCERGGRARTPVLAVAALARPELGTTVTPSLVAAGTAANTVPADASAHFDVRIAHREEAERIAAAFAALRPLPGTSVDVERSVCVPPLERSSLRDAVRAAQALAARARAAAARRGRGRGRLRRQCDRRRSACRCSTASAPSATMPTARASSSRSTRWPSARRWSPRSSRTPPLSFVARPR